MKLLRTNAFTHTKMMKKLSKGKLSTTIPTGTKLNSSKKIVHEISLQLRSITFEFDEKLVGMETRVKDIVSSLEVGADEVRMIGIKGMGGAGKTTLARAVFDHLSADFEATSFVENVREVSNASMFGLKKLQEQVLSKVLNEHVTLDSVTDGIKMMKRRMCGKKVLLVLDDVDHLYQLEALAGEPKWFKPGSRIIVTTRDEQVLVAHRVNSIRDIDLLSDKEAICLLSRYAFGREIPPQEYEELSQKVVLYAAGLPLTVKVLGSFLCGKDMVEWEDAIERLKRIPLKETLKKLELSYISLEDEYKEIFLDIACILKGEDREDAIRILESCGFHARNGLKVLEQRSLITISKDEVLGMHDYIQEMGKNIVRRSHPVEPSKRSRLWITEEIEDIMANDMGSEATRCLRLDMRRGNSRILMEGLGKMKKLRYLDVDLAYFDYQSDPKFDYHDVDLPNSLKYLKCWNYPFLYLPKTFQANNLVGLEMESSRMVQLWKEGEEKVLKKLKFLYFGNSKLMAFDFSITPNLEMVSLKFSYELAELYMPTSCQKLNYLHISYSKLKTFDLGLTPNLETLSLDNCADFVKLKVSVACPNLKFLDLSKSRLRSLDLELIPNLERLNLAGCDELVEFNVPFGCMKKVVHLDLSGCALLEKLPEDLGRLECLEELDITYTGISHLPQSIFGLKGLHINASSEVLQLYDFPSEIKTTTSPLWHDAKFINKIVQETSLELRPINFGIDEKLVGMETRVKDVVSSLEVGINEVRMIGIKGMGGAGKTTTARAAFDHLSADFEAASFVENVREVLNASMFALKNLQEQILSNVLNEHVTVNGVFDGIKMMRKMMCGKKVLLVLDDVDHIEQLKALAGEPNWFKPGSRILITTRDEQVLIAHGVNVIRDIDLLSDKEAICLFSRYAFGRRNPVQGYEELSGNVVRYAAGLPLTVKVLGSFLCGKNKDEWVDAIDRLKRIPLKDTTVGMETRGARDVISALGPVLGTDSVRTIRINGMETRVEDVVSSLEIDIDEVRMIGLKGMGGAGKTTLARAVFDHLYNDFEAKSFVENVREVSNATIFGLKNLQEQVLLDVLNEHVTVNGVIDGMKVMKERMCGKKVLLVLDDVDHIDQLEALAGESEWFKPGSRIIITTRDEQVLVAHRVNVIRDIDLLSDNEAICLFSRFAFGREIPLQGYKELSLKVVRYAAGLPLTIKVLGSFLRDKDMVEWEDAIDRLKRSPLKETLEKLEISYNSLEDDYKEIFLDIACILKGESREYAIRVLECCGFHAKMGLKVLEQRSLITLSEDGFLGMHDHIEEMGKNIVRRSHPDEPNKHSHLWIDEELEDILANDMGTQETRCLKLDKSSGNARIVMKGLGKMKKLRYLEVNFASYDPYQKTSDAECLDDTSQYFPNSLQYLKCTNYPFLYLPRTFQANNLVGLEMKRSRMVQLWEEGEKKVLRKLNFLSLYESKLRTFDLGLTPNLETLSLDNCADFEELHVFVACPNLKFLDLRKSRLRSLDLELIPNLESLDLTGCDELVEVNAPVGCLKKVGFVNLSGCLRFSDFNFCGREPKVNCSSATLELVGESLDLCQLHPNSNLLKLRFRCSYKECLSSSVGNIEKLIAFGLCACTDLKKISDIICSLQCLKTLTLKGDIPEFPKDLGRLECLEELYLSSTKIKHLPDSICMLKRLKSLTVDDGDLLEKLPEDLGQLECLEKLYVRSEKIEYLPDSICMLKRLKSLDVTECCRLGKLPDDIGQLESLESLALWATAIKHLPDSICMLQHLKHLNLSCCALLEKLPEDLGRLECLEHLDITYTCITHLPQSIFGLKGLLIAAPPELLQLYDFPSEIETTTSPI